MFYVGFNKSYLELKRDIRLHGKSSYTFSKRLRLALDSLISFTDFPHKVSTIFGFGIFFSSLLYGLLISFQYVFFGRSLPPGYTLILLGLCILLGSIMMTLGILGLYIYRVYQEVLSRPPYLIKEKVNLP